MGFGLEKHSYSLAAMVFIAAVISGCAWVRPAKPPYCETMELEVEDSRNGWWRARFSVKWPQNTEPSWHTDLFMAHKIVSPVLYRYKDKITLWRFHRRAARDPYGHQFSFIFYCPPETANHIYNAFRCDERLKEMTTAGVITQATYDDPSMITKPNIEDTSDVNWSSHIKRSWPYYIMGVSQMWLNLIAQIAEHTSGGEDPSSLKENQAFYEQVNESIKELWKEQGSHALLHHLNAMFGYEPVTIYEKRLLRF